MKFHANLLRLEDNGKQTIGRLSLYENHKLVFECDTLELTYKDNKKVFSCIPPGNNICKWNLMPRLKKYHYQIMDVLNRSGIFIHSANYYYQLQGCLSLGNGYSDIDEDGNMDVLNSRKTVADFETILNKEDFLLNISYS